MIKKLVLVSAFVVLTACKTLAPIATPHEQIPTNMHLTSSEVKNLLVDTLANRRWEVQRVTDTQIFAKYNKQDKHQAYIVIDYSSKDFTIRYQDSYNLNYRNGSIHRNYNRWVETIRADFNSKLKIQKYIQ